MHMSDLGHHQFLIKTKFKPLHGWMKRDGEKTQKEGEEYYYLNSSTLNITPQPSSQTSVTQIPAMAASGHPSTNKRLHCKVENSFPVTSLYKSRKMSTHYCPNKKNEGGILTTLTEDETFVSSDISKSLLPICNSLICFLREKNIF